MSEEVVTEAPAKKGSKLPIILAVVLMLGGGGFFMMKKGGKATAEVKLSKEEIPIPDEFVVNMLDGKTYVRAKLSVKGGEKFKAEQIEHHNAEVCDAINTILKNTKPEEVITEQQVKKLKIRVATALNKIFNESEGHKKEDGKGDDKKKDEKSDKSGHDASSDRSEKDSGNGKAKQPEPIPNGWDSAEGPIYKVFFKTLATQ